MSMFLQGFEVVEMEASRFYEIWQIVGNPREIHMNRYCWRARSKASLRLSEEKVMVQEKKVISTCVLTPRPRTRFNFLSLQRVNSSFVIIVKSLSTLTRETMFKLNAIEPPWILRTELTYSTHFLASILPENLNVCILHGCRCTIRNDKNHADHWIFKIQIFCLSLQFQNVPENALLLKISKRKKWINNSKWHCIAT